MKVTDSLKSSVSCSPDLFRNTFFGQKPHVYLTKHHCDVIPHVDGIPSLRKLFKTVASSEEVFVGDESSTTSVGLVGLRRSQEQQSSPGELIDLRLLAANRGQLMINISSFSRVIEILPEQNSSFAHRNISHSRPWP